MNNDWMSYRKTLEKELGTDLAHEFTTSLYQQSEGCVELATRFFYTIGRQWAPLIRAWAVWIEQKAESTIAIILRDAKPLTALPETTRWKRLYLNRLICGIADELSGDTCRMQHPLLKKYLRQYSCADHFTFVDSGCYGTVVLELHRLGMQFQPLFFFSKNPHIPGFLNSIGARETQGEILNDSLECCFPHLFLRPAQLTERQGRVRPALCLSDHLSVRFGKAALRGVRDEPKNDSVSASAEVEKLLLRSEEAAHGSFTGFLARSSPEWSKKKEFLEQWPKELSWV